MSEFKYACPVCGQHISCDSSQAGTQMECPTCFQKITVPQAPASEEQKFILTGTKKSERPVSTITDANPIVPRKKSSLVAALILLVLICAAGAAVYAFREKIFKHDSGGVAASGQDANKVTPVAPQANDANWMLNLAAMTNLPDTKAVGRIHGENFILERAVLQNGTLTLREGAHGPTALGLQINFGGAGAEGLSGQSLNITTNAPKAAHVTMFWTENNQTARSHLQGGYAMRLNFEEAGGNRLRGKIYFCAPDESKSYIMGAFNAEIRKSKPSKTR